MSCTIDHLQKWLDTPSKSNYLRNAQGNYVLNPRWSIKCRWTRILGPFCLLGSGTIRDREWTPHERSKSCYSCLDFIRLVIHEKHRFWSWEEVIIIFNLKTWGSKAGNNAVCKELFLVRTVWLIEEFLPSAESITYDWATQGWIYATVLSEGIMIFEKSWKVFHWSIIKQFWIIFLSKRSSCFI